MTEAHNPLSPPSGRAETIPDLIAAAAGRDPDAPALLAPGRPPLAYGALLDQIAATVAALGALGFGRGDRIALALPDGPELAVAFLAAATGAVAVPLNPDLTAPEFERLLGDPPARALVVPAGEESPARRAAAGLGIPLVELSVVPGPAGCFTLAGPPAAAPVVATAPRPDDVALVLQTSGTTGLAKRVPLSHRHLCAAAVQRRDALGLGPVDRGLNLMPMVYVANLSLLLSSLAAGGGVGCPPRFDGARFFDWFAEARPTWFMAPPAMHRAILDRAPAHAAAIAGARLRFVRTGGAPPPPGLVAELETTFNAPVLDGYGLTEAAALVTLTPLPPRPPKPGSVGVAAGCELAVVDEAGTPLHAGAEGEVVVRGANVYAGYEGEAAPAGEVFFPGGWFRTGDLGHLDGDGYLFITGRRKEQINRGGEKVSPVEVEAALLAHPTVAEAVAFAVPDERLGEEVAAAVVPRDGATVEPGTLRAAAAERLAPFKVPRLIVLVDELPRGATGKLRRVGLADALGLGAAPAVSPAAAPDHVPPRRDAERLLTEIWAEVLRIEPARIGVADDFLALGGDSLDAAQVVARLHQLLAIDLPVASFFAAPTIAAMADLVEELLLAEAESASGPAVAPAAD